MDPRERDLTGSRLGSCELKALIGAGGMGEVYRARDLRLGRDVAVKILPHGFTDDPERLGRFEREAHLLASLNHPNIGAIYGLEETGDIRGLILELVEGQTLAEWIAARPAPSSASELSDVLSIARQIADALEAAHEKGIVHRDLKPANIKITPEGLVKVLDFGLAKAAAAGPSPEVSQSPTMTVGGTREGVILGTVAYMSPEQARGKPVDKRTDIWAFGCVLYEMLTGRRPFHGETRTDVLAAVLEREPDWDALPHSPPATGRLVRRCLAKDPRCRLHDIADARIEIEEALAGAPESAAAVTPAVGRPLAWLLAGALLVSAAFAAWQWTHRARAAPAAVRFQRITDFVGLEESPAISPDGKTVAFVAPSGGKRQIWVRLLAGGVPLQITHDDSDHDQPRWASDSSTLIYFSPTPTPGEQGALWEVSMLGGAPRRIAATLGAGDISHDGRRIAAFQFEEGHSTLVVLGRDGARSKQLLRFPDDAFGINPRWSPDDRRIAFNDGTFIVFDDGISVIAADGGERRRIVAGGTLRGVCWLPDGSGLVYGSSSGSTVLYPPIFNLRIVDLEGGSNRQVTFGDVSYTAPDAHVSGTLAVSRTRIQSDIWRFPVDGSPEENTRAGLRITRHTGQAQAPSASPDGRQLVYVSDSGGHGNLWVIGSDGSNARQITFERDPAAAIGAAIWSPQGNPIAFIRTLLGSTEQWRVNPDSGGVRSWLPGAVAASWSRDGAWLYHMSAKDGESCIEKTPAAGGSALRVRCSRTTPPTAPQLSKDGSTLYFVTRLIGANGGWDYELRRARPEGAEAESLARIAGSRVPFDPKLFLPALSPDEEVLAVPLADGATTNLWTVPAAGGPLRRITDFGDRATLIVRRVSWSPDGKYLYAAVADLDADIVMIDGVLR